MNVFSSRRAVRRGVTMALCLRLWTWTSFVINPYTEVGSHNQPGCAHVQVAHGFPWEVDKKSAEWSFLWAFGQWGKGTRLVTFSLAAAWQRVGKRGGWRCSMEASQRNLSSLGAALPWVTANRKVWHYSIFTTWNISFVKVFHHIVCACVVLKSYCWKKGQWTEGSCFASTEIKLQKKAYSFNLKRFERYPEPRVARLRNSDTEVRLSHKMF